MTPEDLEHTIAALSARLMALESLVAALAANATVDRNGALASYDAAAREILDRYTGLPVNLYSNSSNRHSPTYATHCRRLDAAIP